MTPAKIPFAADYTFISDRDPKLAQYLNDHTELDPATGCKMWLGKIGANGQPRVPVELGRRYGSRQAARLAWRLHHGKKLENAKSITHLCGCSQCINPHHFALASHGDRLRDITTDLRMGAIGSLTVAGVVLPANEVWGIQQMETSLCPAEGIRKVIYWREPEVVHAVRRSPIRATRTVMADGFRRYDLPPGITEIAPANLAA